MKRIDSPTDVALTEYESEPEDTTREIVLKISGALFPPIGLAAALRDHFSSKNRYDRIRRVFVAFKSDIEGLQKESAQNATRTQAIEDRLKSPKFTEAVLTAAEEAARTAESKKLDRLASTLANGVDPDIIQPEDDLPSLVRDVSQLSELDLKTLNIIITTAPLKYLGGAASSSERTDTSLGGALLANAGREEIENDDFYSTAYRLVGFGLVLEVSSLSGRRPAKHLSFVPTKRGRKLDALLKKRT